MPRSTRAAVFGYLALVCFVSSSCDPKGDGLTGGPSDPGQEPQNLDRDQDGVPASGPGAERDCNDDDPDRFPGNEERCDFVDQDCDGDFADFPAACPLSCEGSPGACETPVDLIAGPAHTCALTDAGSVYCWGSNAHGELGNAELTFSAYPLRVPGVSGATTLFHSDTRVCARIASGALCWGHGLRVPVFTSVPTAAVEVATFADQLCWRTAAGVAACRDLLSGAAAPERVLVNGTMRKAVSIKASQKHVCAGLTSMEGATERFEIDCWGTTASGEGGQVLHAGKNQLFEVSSVSPRACSVSAGELRCGELSYTSSNSYRIAAGNGGAVQVGLGGRHACARNGAGRVACWEGSLEGAIEDVKDLAVGDRHACVLRTDGGIACWGSRVDGALGDGTFEFGSANSPVDVVPGAPFDAHGASPLLMPGASLGACDNVDDVRKIASGGHRKYDACLAGCDTMLDPTACRAKCVSQGGLSSACTSCYTQLEACEGGGCYEAFVSCAGFRADFQLGPHTYSPRSGCRAGGCYQGLPLGSECEDLSDCLSGACARLPVGKGNRVCVVPNATVCSANTLVCTCDPEKFAYCGSCSGELLAQSTPNAFLQGTCYRRCETDLDCFSGDRCAYRMCQ